MLAGGATVKITLAGFEATSIKSKSNFDIVVVAKTGTAKKGDVVITANTGGTVTKKTAWEQLKDGVITKVDPAKGHFGTTVVITGERMFGGSSDAASVTLAGVKATYTAGSGSATKITVVSGVSANVGTAGDVVIVGGEGSIVTAVKKFTHVKIGKIVKIVPNSGQAGTKVEITGTDMLGGGTSITSIVLLDTAVASITSSSDTSIKAVVKARIFSGKGSVVLTANTGAIVSIADLFTDRKSVV